MDQPDASAYVLAVYVVLVAISLVVAVVEGWHYGRARLRSRSVLVAWSLGRPVDDARLPAIALCGMRPLDDGLGAGDGEPFVRALGAGLLAVRQRDAVLGQDQATQECRARLRASQARSARIWLTVRLGHSGRSVRPLR